MGALRRQEDEKRLSEIFQQQLRVKAEEDALAAAATKKMAEAFAPPQSPARSRKPLVFGRIVRTPSTSELKPALSMAKQEAEELFARPSSTTTAAPSFASPMRSLTPSSSKPSTPFRKTSKIARPSPDAAVPSAMMMDLGMEATPATTRWSKINAEVAVARSPSQSTIFKSSSLGNLKFEKAEKSGGISLPTLSTSKSASNLPSLKAAPVFASKSQAGSWDVPFALGTTSKRYDLSLAGF